MAESRRPVLVSVMQFEDELNSGAITIGDVITATARLGADGLEIRPQYWREKDRELPAARDAIAGHNLIVTYATTITLFSADPADWSRLRQDIDDTRTLGASQLRVFPGPVPADDDAEGWAAGQTIVDYAAGQGITLALENYAWTPGGTIAELARTLEHFPALAVNLDIGNYQRHGEDVGDAIRLFGERAVSAHLKDQGGAPDWPSFPLGGGALDLPRIMAALEALPQRLLYCFEFRGGGDPQRRIARSLAYLRGREWGR
jgi:sugar phosphate isomerase/epimerase